MRRISLGLITVIVIAATAVVGARAVAQPEPMTTVTPRANLLDGQSVSVAATDWPASTNLTVEECGYVPAVGTSCFSPQHVMTDTAGSFRTSYVVHRFLDNGDCVATTAVQCVLSVADASFSETFTLRFNPASSQGPDLIIRRRSDGTLLFDNVYTTTTVAYVHPIVAGGYWTFAVLVQNDGPAAADITVHANSVAAPFAVQYFSGYFDVTANVTGSGLAFPAMAPGESRPLAVRFRTNPAAPLNTSAQIRMTATTPRVSGPQDTLTLGVVTGS